MAKSKLNQIIAVESGVKATAHRELTDLYHQLQKAAGFVGLARSYTPYEDGGETLPSESTRVQLKAKDILGEMAKCQTKLYDITATKDYGNCAAVADVVVNGVVILPAVPVAYLLFLEKKLVDIHTFIGKLPLLDAADVWSYDTSQDCYATPPIQTARTKKILRNHVKAEATDKHPAQVDVYNEDVRCGTWSTIKYSGSMPATEVKKLLQKVEVLQEAVKFAREQANGNDVANIKVGDAVFGFLFS